LNQCRGKGEDTFGLKDEDWQLYKLMSKDTDDDDDVMDPDEDELARVATKLQVVLLSVLKDLFFFFFCSQVHVCKQVYIMHRDGVRIYLVLIGGTILILLRPRTDMAQLMQCPPPPAGISLRKRLKGFFLLCRNLTLLL
jgi:hypothetical protein